MLYNINVLADFNGFQKLNVACDTVILNHVSVSSSNLIVLIDF